MKAQISGKAFRPVTITVESMDELLELWHRLNLPDKAVDQYWHQMESGTGAPRGESADIMAMWRAIDNVLEEMGMRYDDY